jgi:predicted acylesterase/phospholipase RssA
MSVIDMVFEGGGAKGMVFVGALEVLLRGGEHVTGRLLGTSAGAITAALLAARYTVNEMKAALVEQDANGRPVFESFLGAPGPFDAATVKASAVRRFLTNLDVPGVPDFVETRIDDFIASRMAAGGYPAHFFSFVEQGGWYAADAFVAWMTRKLNEGTIDGRPRAFGDATLSQLFSATGVDVTLVAADTTGQRVLLLNHRTAPDLPVVWATRMSMSIPLLWQEVVWKSEWGAYKGEEIAGAVVVDGGMLSNFPIALFLSARPEIGDVVGPPATKNVLGMLIDDKLDVPGLPPVPAPGTSLSVGRLATVQRLARLVQTMTSAHDNMAIAVFAKHVVRLPARGVGVIQFDMDESTREALVQAGRDAMAAFLANQTVLELTGELDLSAPPDAVNLADEAALEYLRGY